MNENNNHNLQLKNLLDGMPGITPIEGANLYENCIVQLHRCEHPMPVNLKVGGLNNCTYKILWEDIYNDQFNRTYADEQSVTERAAIGVSALLAFETTEYTIVERSRKGTGFDYMLGDKNDTLFIPKARLEISGIKTETESNSIEKRFKQKALQTDISDKSGLPAYISIIEFSTPKAVFDLKRIAI